MLVSHALLSATLLAAASIQPAQVPATAKQTAELHIEQAGMFHISARSGHGTACELVDHLRGPFARAGIAGRENCELDLLLDAGAYRLRLESPERGQGRVTLAVEPFAERFDKPLSLPAGRSDHVQLPPGQQASWWLRIPERRYTELTVLGRTAGVVRLWRDGRWVEAIGVQHAELSPRAGQPLHAWKLAGVLEPGDYRLTAYGAAPKPWAKGGRDDVLFVAHGYPDGPPERFREFSLPAWGRLALQVPKGSLSAFVSLDGPPAGDVRLELLPQPDEQGDRTGSADGFCRIAPKELVPVCSALGASDARHVLVISGPPGTSGRLRWAGYWSGGPLADGLYGSPRTALEFTAPASGDFLVATDDVPLDADAAPLACQLDPVRGVRWGKTLHDDLALSDERVFERRFNYDGRGAQVWFEIGKPGLYRIALGGERQAHCELFQLEGDRQHRLASGCRLEQSLGAGHYRLRLYNGTPGIESLSIRSAEAGPGARRTTKNSCLLSRVALQKKGRYRLTLNRGGRITARGLVLRPLPLSLERPLPLVIDPGQSVSLPAAAGAAIEVRASGRPAFLCALGRRTPSTAVDGVCRLAAGDEAGELTVSNPGDESLAVMVLRPRPPARPAALSTIEPEPRRLPELAPGRTRYFDFERGQSRSLVFDVPQAGLYHLTTVGLLDTECRVRTPIFSSLAADRSSGRGRNCLVASYLRPGRYLLTATAQGLSRGRAGVRVERRPLRKVNGVAGEGQAFFRVAADELVEQPLTVRSKGRYRLTTSGQGVALQCRLEDRDGWPLLPVPAACSQTLELDAGRYRWGQLPLTVESMRSTRLEQVRPLEVLQGDKPHRVRLNHDYLARLGPDGQDEFRFRLEAPLEVTVRLGSGMQARLFRAKAAGRPELVEVIPPDRAAVGQRLALSPGAYRLRTEHPRADVGIQYRLALRSEVLAPGLAMDAVAVPGELTVRMPKDGVLRLKSEGQTDVRCRLFDGAGDLVAEGDDVGADWNCLLAVPVAAGDYRLVLEAENAIPGTTRISADAPEVKPVGALADGKLLETGNHVLLAELPRPAGEAVVEVGLTSRLRFSCALEDAEGRELGRQLDVLRCGYLVHSRAAALRLRLWTRRWSGKLKVKLAERPLVASGGGRIPAGRAVRVEVPRSGLYRTAAKVWCLPAGDSGPLRFCGPEASLAQGPVIFSTTGPRRRPELRLAEQVLDLDRPAAASPRLDDRPRWQRQRSGEPALHLLSLQAAPGEPAAAACRIDGGVFRLAPGGCFAASGPARETLARFWLTSARPRPAALVRRSAAVPPGASELRPGDQRLVWSGPTGRFRLPAARSRLELLLPGDAWALQTDSAGRPVDLCAPAGRLSRCVLGAEGGELYLVSDAERQARLRLLLVPAAPEARILADRFESWPLAAGQTRLRVPAAGQARRLEVRGALACRVALDDGTRLGGCELDLPAGSAALLQIEHQARPLSAVVAPAGQLDRVRWGSAPPAGPGAPLAMAEALPLAGGLVARRLELTEPRAISLHADAGLCALLSPDGGLEVIGQGLGCELDRVLLPGAYRVLVRPMAGRPLGGSLVWVGQAVEELGEGVGLEEWIAPGQVRTYRFRVATDGQLGLGVRAEADLLACRVLDARQRTLGRGCQQLLELAAGEYLLRIEAPADARPLRYRPVLLGLAGSRQAVPEQYLRDFFRRIGFEPHGGQR